MPRRGLVHVVFGVFAVGAMTGCTAAAVQPPAPSSVSVAGFNPLSPALAEALHHRLPDITFTHTDTGVATANVEQLQSGDADLGLTFADIAYIGFTGRLEGHASRLDRLRGIAVLQLTPLHLVVRASSPIRSLADLCGRKVAVGVRGSGTSLTSALTLSAHPCRTPVDRQQLLYPDAVTALRTGAIDAMFVIQGYPSEAVMMAMRGGGRLVDVSGPPVKHLQTEYPFLRAALIPGATYPGQSQDVHTVGVDMLLACRSGLDEMLVYRITRALFESLPELSNKVGAMRTMQVDRAMAMPIPLHEGAARYYRERELLQ